jgi:ribonuclease P protein component
LGFGRADRLRKSGEFIQLQRRGARYQSGHFVLYGLGGAKDEPSRLGITVSRRVGNAVVRNRLKRRLREYYRLKMRAMLPAGVAMVVIARKGAGDLEGATIDAELIAGAVALGHKLTANPRTETKTRTETGPESKAEASTEPSARTNLRERDRP